MHEHLWLMTGCLKVVQIDGQAMVKFTTTSMGCTKHQSVPNGQVSSPQGKDCWIIDRGVMRDGGKENL